jgi:hypothetical protein
MFPFSSDQIRRTFLLASTLGCIVGLSEGAVDILSGAAIISGWVPGGFQLEATSRILYIVFNVFGNLTESLWETTLMRGQA